MFKPSESFQPAIQDYILLLERKYSQKSILKLVGDRYKLNRTERSMLYHGIASNAENISRPRKLIHGNSIQNQLLYIDGFNQILTIASYLNGNLVYISTDNLLRDASEIHGKVFRKELLERSLNLILEYCNSLKLNNLILYIDKQVSNHKKLVETLSCISLSKSFIIEVKISNQVDLELKKLKDGIIATSDSQIIDKSKQKIFNLAYHTLKFHFNPNFFDLGSMINKKH